MASTHYQQVEISTIRSDRTHAPNQVFPSDDHNDYSHCFDTEDGVILPIQGTSFAISSSDSQFNSNYWRVPSKSKAKRQICPRCHMYTKPVEGISHHLCIVCGTHWCQVPECQTRLKKKRHFYQTSSLTDCQDEFMMDHMCCEPIDRFRKFKFDQESNLEKWPIFILAYVLFPVSWPYCAFILAYEQLLSRIRAKNEIRCCSFGMKISIGLICLVLLPLCMYAAVVETILATTRRYAVNLTPTGKLDPKIRFMGYCCLPCLILILMVLWVKSREGTTRNWRYYALGVLYAISLFPFCLVVFPYNLLQYVFEETPRVVFRSLFPLSYQFVVCDYF